MSADIGGLPDHMQLMVVGTVITVSSIWGVVKFLKPLIDNLTPKETAKTTDAVVISAALADGKPIRELTESVDKLCASQDKGNIINQMLLDAVLRLVHKP